MIDCWLLESEMKDLVAGKITFALIQYDGEYFELELSHIDLMNSFLSTYYV